MSLLDDRDQERIIKAVDTLDHTDKKGKTGIIFRLPGFEIGNADGIY